MAESVDALVSNTSGVKSIPVRPRVWVQEESQVLSNQLLGFLFFLGDISLFGSIKQAEWRKVSVFSLSLTLVKTEVIWTGNVSAKSII